MKLSRRIIPVVCMGAALACAKPIPMPQAPAPLDEPAQTASFNESGKKYYTAEREWPVVVPSPTLRSILSIRKSSDFGEWENFLHGVSGKKPVPFKDVFFSPRSTLHSKCGDAYGCYSGPIHIFSDSLHAVSYPVENCRSISGDLR